jgi:hypothetical protein
MKAGSFKRYILYAVGEVILIVVGVLIAVSLNNSNNFRVKRLQEQQIVVRISNELNAGINRTSIFQSRLLRKAEALESLRPFFQGKVIEDKKSFLESVILASTFGWEQPPLEQTTFREILNSGQLSLILDTELRLQLTRFYHFVTQSEERSNLRMSQFPRIAHKLIPWEGENELQESLSDEAISEIVATVLKSDLQSHLISEQNRAKFIIDTWDSMKTQSIELQKKLDARKRPGVLSESNFPSSNPSS